MKPRSQSCCLARLTLPFAALLALVGGCNMGGGGWNTGNSTGSGRSNWTLFGGGRGNKTEEWTIECNAYESSNHRALADSLATALKRVRELRPNTVRVVHVEKRSLIYYGTYDLPFVAADGDQVIKFSPEIKRDLRFIRGLSVNNKFPFFQAHWVPVPIPDAGPPEWNLRGAKGAYTLHVGVTYNTPTLHDYKQAAVQWVQVLRQDGFEAYYFHHPDRPRSDICVGTFERDALVREADGSLRYSEDVLRLQTQSDFRWNLENGLKMFRGPRGQAGKGMANQSFLVLIPSEDNAGRRRPPPPPRRR